MEVKEEVRRIKNGKKKAFEKLFFTYYQQLCNFAVTIVMSPELARDCVQDVFLKLWRNRENWEIKHSLSAYLYQSVRNQALNILQKKKNQREYTQKYYEQDFRSSRQETVLSDNHRNLIKAIWTVTETMPPRRKRVFQLHRKHGLSYKEIASVMDISRKTVENHMGMALQEIRDKLACEKDKKYWG